MTGREWTRTASDLASSDDTSDGGRLYRQLRQELAAAGCFILPNWVNAGKMAAVLAIYAALYGYLLTDPGWPLRLMLCAALAVVVVQSGFIAHEAGHLSIARSRLLANLYGQVFMTVATGVTHAFFQDIHRRHHAVTNTLADDPDMQSALFSVDEESARMKGRLGCWITASQGHLVWLFMNLQAFSFKIDSLCLLARKPRHTHLDQAMLCVHLIVWLVVPASVIGFWQAALNYSLLTWLVGPYLAASFYTNHVGAEVIGAEQKISFLHRQLATSRNVGGSRVNDILFGGLNHHIEHHLFPTIPTCKLRVARSITRAFCRRNGLAYRETSWPRAVGEVLHHLHVIAAFARTQRRAVAASWSIVSWMTVAAIGEAIVVSG